MTTIWEATPLCVQVRKPGLREVKSLASGHRARTGGPTSRLLNRKNIPFYCTLRRLRLTSGATSPRLFSDFPSGDKLSRLTLEAFKMLWIRPVGNDNFLQAHLYPT